MLRATSLRRCNGLPPATFKRSLLSPEYLYSSLAARGTSAFFGVPDSLLAPLCGYIADHTPATRHVIAANEGNAMSLAAGHHLATGEVPCVYLQNSGLGNTVNPVLSLMHTDVYRLPCLMLVGWRGEPGLKDEPQHRAQGKLTERGLTAMDVPYSIVGETDDMAFCVDAILDKAYYHFRSNGTPYAVLFEKGMIAPYAWRHESQSRGDAAPALKLTREQVIEQILRQLNDTDIVVSTTGMPSREVFEARARAGQGHRRDFLTVGGMGHCSSIAAGIALARPERGVYCLDGDGAAIMHMGAMAVNGGGIAASKDLATGAGPLQNYKHIVVNNGAHDSVGGQPTAAFDVSLTGVAQACGYVAVREEPVIELGDLVAAMADLREVAGPAFLEVLVERGSRADLGRPTSTPLENKKAFMAFVQGTGEEAEGPKR